MLHLAVSPDVLIPRPETELLVEAALEALRDMPSPRVVDVGTGSGAIVLALAAEVPGATLFATDVSEAALEMARHNARETGFDERISFRHGHLLTPLANERPFDAVVANLPYVTRDEWQALEPEVRDHEPRGALVGGEDGLDVIRELVSTAQAPLLPGGFLAIEVGWKQAPAVRALLADAGWQDVETRRDLAGIERVVTARKPAG